MMDTTERLEIYGSPWKFLGLGLLGIMMTAGSAALVYFGGQAQTGGLEQVVGYVGLIFFGACTLLIFWRVLTLTGPIITISGEGIRDKRVAVEVIPWSAIERIGTWSTHGQKMTVLSIDPHVEGRLTLTRVARWSRGPNAALGADGLSISAQGLKISYDKLLEIVCSYAAAARDGSTASPR